MTITVHLPRPHAKQRAFIESMAKRKVIRAGRRSGKTVGIGIYSIRRFLNGHRVLYAAPTAEQIERFWTTITRALSEPIKAGIYHKNETLHIIELAGTEQRIRAKTAWNADTLRGDYGDDLILDEFQLMNEDTWGVVGAPMMLDTNGNTTFIYTPPSLHSRSVTKANDPQHAAKLFARAKADTIGRWATFHFTSHDNPHLSKEALSEITYDMTALAYQMEIMAEDINEAPGALWKRETLDKYRVTEHPDFDRVVVAVDPSGTTGGDEVGIVTAGRANGEIYPISDASLHGSPLEWAKAAIAEYHTHRADVLVAEANYGGEMVKAVILGVDPTINVKMVTATRGKAIRAEPISAAYEKGRAHHVGYFPALEDELCFIAGTMITTDRGDIEIEKIKSGDKVLTRKGYYPVLHAGKTGQVSRLIEIYTYNKRHLLTTVSHLIYNNGRFVRADNLKSGDKLETNQWHINRLKSTNMESQSYGMIDDGLSTTVGITWTGKVSNFIERFGNFIMEKYRRAILFIIEMEINSISALKILNVFRYHNIANIIHATNGMLMRGIIYPGTCIPDGQTGNTTRLFVRDAELSLKARECVQCSVPKDVEGDIIKSIEIIESSTDVYNLSIETEHEYYANGILVHNCLWVQGDKSPNRLDALVWCGIELLGVNDWAFSDGSEAGEELEAIGEE